MTGTNTGFKTPSIPTSKARGQVVSGGGKKPRPINQAQKTILSSRKVQQENMRILLAEDNFTNQQVALGILKKIGVHAEIATNGVEALEILGSTPFDLVLMDCQMPEMDGYEATRQIRNTESQALDHNIPVIAMTANAMTGDREKCLGAGMDDYITKPVDTAELVDKLNQWLPKK